MVVLFLVFFSFDLRNYIFQSAEKCEMTSFSITSLHVDLNEAAKCTFILLASLLRLRTRVQNTKWRKFMKVGGIKTWKGLTIGLQQLVRLFLTIISSTPNLSFKSNFYGVQNYVLLEKSLDAVVDKRFKENFTGTCK